MKYIGIVSRCFKTESNRDINGIEESYRKVLSIYPDIYPILLLPPKNIYYGSTSSSEELMEDISINSKVDDLLKLCDGFLIPGGNRWFSFDEYVINYAYSNNKPILGICLGMQLMSIVDNKINDGIYKENKLIEGFNHLDLDKDLVHEVSIKDNSLLRDILNKDKIMVNSRHSYQVPNTLNFDVSAVSNDGVIEAIERCDLKFALGVQWHPELLVDINSEERLIFDRFIEEVRNEKN